MRNTKKSKIYFIEDIQAAAAKINTANDAVKFLNGIFQECYARNMDELCKVANIAKDIEMNLREKFNIAEERDGKWGVIAGAKEHFSVKEA